MFKALFVSLTLLGSISAIADQVFYVKTASGFKQVEKTEAVLAILQNKQTVMKCAEQRLTKKLTLKAVSRNDD